jgi:hypothetical protein
MKLSALLAILVTTLAHAQAIYDPPPGQNFEGVWLIQGEHSTVKTLDGKLPPMTRTAAARYKARNRASDTSRPANRTGCRAFCLPPTR